MKDINAALAKFYDYFISYKKNFLIWIFIKHVFEAVDLLLQPHWIVNML